jgi:RND family efflux transporter MFP subunit
LSAPQLSKETDRLATLRINRSRSRPAHSRWGSRLILVGLALGLLAAASWVWSQYGEVLTRPEVQTAMVEVRSPGAAESVLSAQGYLKSEKQAAIGAKVAGRVLKVYVREGQPVAVNDVLAELEHADIDQTLKAMQASLEARDASLAAMRLSLAKAKAELVEVEATLLKDEREFTRVERLFRSGVQTASEYERAEAAWKASQSRRDSMVAAVAVAESRLSEAEALLRESQARLQEASEQRQNLFVRAPFQGIVISKQAEEGESIMPGGMGEASGRGSVVTLADLLHLEVETDVKEDYVSRVKKGQPVSVSVDAVPNHRFGGRVRTIIPMGDRAKGTVKVKVLLNEDEVAEVNDPRSETFTLFPEMAATVYFLSDDAPAVSGAVVPEVYAPQTAVRTDPDGSFVWKVVDQRVARVAVETGDAQNGRVRILRGLTGGERLVLQPPPDLHDKQLVRIEP